MDLITISTVVATVVPLILFFGWVVLKHPEDGKVNVAAFIWLAALIIFEWWLIGYSEAHLWPNFLPPLLSWMAGVLCIIIRENHEDHRTTVGHRR